MTFVHQRWLSLGSHVQLKSNTIPEVPWQSKYQTNLKDITAISAYCHVMFPFPRILPVSHLDVIFFPSSRNSNSDVLKASGNLERATNSVLGTVLSLPVTRWAYHALWPLNVTLAFNVACCVPASKPPSLFIRQISQTPGSELCGPSLLCNRSRLHCDTCQRGRKWRSDLLNYLCGNPPLSIPLPAWDQSVTQSVFAQRCMQWALATRRSERWI